MSLFSQSSFSSGELSPQIRQRNELAQVYSGLSYANNFIVTQTGNLVNRGGFQFIAKTDENSKQMVFDFGFGQIYILEFIDSKMYVIRNDGLVLKNDITITSQNNTTYTTSSLTNIVNNDLMFVDGNVYKLTKLNNTEFELVNTYNNQKINTAYTTISPVYYMTTPYQNQHLNTLQYVQSTDTLIVTSEHYPPKNIVRLGHDNWTINDISYSPSFSPPTPTNTIDTYEITAVNQNTGEESQSYKATSSSTSGNDTSVTFEVLTNTNTVTYEYNIFKVENGIAGFIGIAKTSPFIDKNITPDFKQTPPELRNFFENNNPFTAVYHNQRTIYGGTVNEPQCFYGSKIGDFNNFNKTFPIQDDDPFKFQLNSLKSQRIRHLISMRGIFAFTDSSIWYITGDNNGLIKPNLINAEEQVVRSTSKIKPLRIGRDILFLLEGGRDVQLLNYNYEINGFDVLSLTTFASHLFEDEYIIDWDYAEKPFGIIVCVTNKGNAFVLTYNKEQQILAWTRLETSGEMLSVISMPKDNEDYLIFKVKRTNGVFLEKMNNRDFKYYYDGNFLDSYSVIDNFNDEVLTLTSTTTNDDEKWTTNDTIKIESANNEFTASSVNKKINIKNNTTVTLTITSFIDTKTVLAKPNILIQEDLRTNHRWGFSFQTISGLYHLEGKKVSVVYDGGNGTEYTVTNGSITLSQSSAFACIGLPYIATMRNIDINTPKQNLMNKQKKVKKVFVSYLKTFGISSSLSDGKKQENDKNVELYTKTESFTLITSNKQEGIIEIVQSKPFPANITSLSIEVDISDVN